MPREWYSKVLGFNARMGEKFIPSYRCGAEQQAGSCSFGEPRWAHFFNLEIEYIVGGNMPLTHFGRLAQLVQSACLTDKRSAVRICYRPQQLSAQSNFKYKAGLLICWLRRSQSRVTNVPTGRKAAAVLRGHRPPACFFIACRVVKP